MKQEKNSVTNQHACHYITFNTVDWVDIFVRPVYKYIVVDTLNDFIAVRGLTIHAWCLMSNHLHLLLQAKDGIGLSMIERDFKRITSTAILEAIEMEPELRRHWMLSRFEHSSVSLKKLEKYQVWQSCSNPEFLDFRQPMKVRDHLNYVHENPVRDRIVRLPEEYVFSSAGDYNGRKGLVNVKVIDMEGLIRGLMRNGG
ncbi:transposase [Paraflavitalea sp. CAU 1676]|uniref:transposase n=1 Tax=Paraflavitalea sp. CAU 1676 TaxID=3032598 RepID=UPI0023DC8898|nr:transposase [Paraflavitalea sp. CAU 1676]MDF2191171.1 transposase [Paraflavitalea sp. CAU 1676]